jgi:phosphatidylglycerophosphate synthase
MHLIGVLLAPEATASSLIVGGLTILERQARTLRRLGCNRLLLVAPPPLTLVPEEVEMVSVSHLPTALNGGGIVVVLAPGLVIDERPVAALIAAALGYPALLVCADAATSEERLDAATLAAGAMALPAAMIADVAAGLGDWDFHSTLIRLAAADPKTVRVAMEATPLYAADRRRQVPLLWARPETADGASAVTTKVIGAAQKGVLDWPARFLHPFVEDTLVRLLAPTAVTPNMVTIFTGLLGVAAGIGFATGALWWGLGLALLCGPLDGVDGKLARTRIEFSRWGDLEHALDKLLEYGWYLCAAWWFSGALASGLPWAIAALIIVPALAEAVQGEFYRRMTGAQLDDAGDFERRVRLVAGRRNTFMWTWLAMALFGLWFEGFVLLACYSMVTMAVAQWRFYKRLGEFARAGDARVQANYAATRYDFLAKASLPTEKL